MSRTPTQMRAAARVLAKREPHPAVVGMCLRVSRELYRVPALHPNAAAAWEATRLRGEGPAPAGALHYWLGGAQGLGHVAPGEGPRRVWSIDNVRRGGLDLVTLARIARTWPALVYAGWARDVNGEEVLPLVRVGAAMTRPATVLIVTRALAEEELLPERFVGGDWTHDVTVAYARWQSRAGYGPPTPGRPGPADGRPGIKSLTALGLRRGFATA